MTPERDDLIRALGNLIGMIDEYIKLDYVAPLKSEHKKLEEARDIHAKATKR